MEEIKKKLSNEYKLLFIPRYLYSKELWLFNMHIVGQWAPFVQKAQLFSVFKCIHGINLCSHLAQWDTVNKKSNVSTISYYIHTHDLLDWEENGG